MGRSATLNAGGFLAMFYEWTVLNGGSFKNVRHMGSLTSSGIRHSQRYLSPRQTSSTRSAETPRNLPISIISNARRHFQTTLSRSSATASTPDASSKSPMGSPLSERLRTIMRQVPHSVVVVTSKQLSLDRRTPPSPKGMTVSSFTTLTLTPTPIITLNIRKPSSTLSAIISSKHFFIHVLNATYSGAKIADTFAKNGEHVFTSEDFVVVKRKKSAMDEPPLLAAKGITTALKCKLLEENGVIEVGDHTLILAEVQRVVESGREGQGLFYTNGEYRHLAGVIQVVENKGGEK